MGSLNKRAGSFVLCIWWEERDPSPGSRQLWRGWVQHVRSGEASYVQDLEGLLGFIQRWAGGLTARDAWADMHETNVVEADDVTRGIS